MAQPILLELLMPCNAWRNKFSWSLCWIPKENESVVLAYAYAVELPQKWFLATLLWCHFKYKLDIWFLGDFSYSYSVDSHPKSTLREAPQDLPYHNNRLLFQIYSILVVPFYALTTPTPNSASLVLFAYLCGTASQFLSVHTVCKVSLGISGSQSVVPEIEASASWGNYRIRNTEWRPSKLCFSEPLGRGLRGTCLSQWELVQVPLHLFLCPY